MRKLAAMLTRKVLPWLISAGVGFGLARLDWPAPTEKAIQTAADAVGPVAADKAAEAIEGN